MHLILNHMSQFQEVCDTYCSRLVEHFTRLTVIKVCRTEVWQSCLVCPISQVLKFCTIEDRCSKLDTQTLTCCTKDCLEYLPKVHTRWHTQWVQNQVNRTTISQEWHIFLTYYLRDNTLITMTTGKFITYTDFTFLGHIDLSHLNDTGR